MSDMVGRAGASRERDSQALSAPHPLPTQPQANPLEWGGTGRGTCRPQTSPQQSPSHPPAIMRFSALPETEGIVCTGCSLRCALRKARLSWATSTAWGCRPARHNKPRAGKGPATLPGRGAFETPSFKTPRSQGREGKWELWIIQSRGAILKAPRGSLTKPKLRAYVGKIDG